MMTRLAFAVAALLAHVSGADAKISAMSGAYDGKSQPQASNGANGGTESPQRPPKSKKPKGRSAN
ncbi:MAG: hypothetical protein ACT4OU_04665 [Hyphomicrobium sp.]